MLMERDELLDAIENTQNKINSVKEMLARAADLETAGELSLKLKSLLNTHLELIDQLG